MIANVFPKFTDGRILFPQKHLCSTNKLPFKIHLGNKGLYTFYCPLLQRYCLLLDEFSCHISVSLYSNIAVLCACCWTSFFFSSCVYNSLGAQAIISPTLNTWPAKLYISLTFWSVVSKTVFFYRKVPKSSIEEAPWWKDEINEHEK